MPAVDHQVCALKIHFSDRSVLRCSVPHHNVLAGCSRNKRRLAARDAVDLHAQFLHRRLQRVGRVLRHPDRIIPDVRSVQENHLIVPSEMVVVIRRKACQRASRQVFHRRKRCLLGSAEDHHLVSCHADDVIHAVALAVVPQFGQDVDRCLTVRLAHQNFKPVVRNFLALAHPVGVGLQTDSELLLDLLLQGYGRLADVVVCKLVAENGVVFQSLPARSFRFRPGSLSTFRRRLCRTPQAPRQPTRR